MHKGVSRRINGISNSHSHKAPVGEKVQTFSIPVLALARGELWFWWFLVASGVDLVWIDALASGYLCCAVLRIVTALFSGACVTHTV